jgi:serine/threonine-protein kinase
VRGAGRLPLDAAVRITERVAEALDHAHRHGIVHRNVTPDSIVLSRDDVALADVGLAAGIRASIVDDACAVSDADGARIALAIATPGYMSPEQTRGEEPLDGRTDVYSLACVAYEMLVGASPFRAGTRQGTLSRQVVGAVPPIGPRRADVPDSIDDVFHRAFARDASLRYAVAGDFAADLRAAAERPVGLLSRVRRFATGLTRAPMDARLLP